MRRANHTGLAAHEHRRLLVNLIEGQPYRGARQPHVKATIRPQRADGEAAMHLLYMYISDITIHPIQRYNTIKCIGCITTPLPAEDVGITCNIRDVTRRRASFVWELCAPRERRGAQW